MKLAYVTRSFPFEYLGEAFLEPEVRALADACQEVHVLPVRPGARHPLFGNTGAIDVFMSFMGLDTLLGSIAEAWLHPVRAALALKRVLAPRYRLSAKLKNLALFPKALAMARYVRHHGIEHVHAHWLTTPATVAYVVSTMTGVPWSCTGHSHDVYADNLLEDKAASAKFVRIISRRNYQSFNETTGRRYRDRTRVVHVGVHIPVMPARSAAHGKMLNILCPARLDPTKGHCDLLTALALLRDAGVEFHCDLAGAGALRREVERNLSRLGLRKYVTMLGVVAHDRLLDEMQSGRYDAVVLASIEDKAVTEIFEGIPVALMEAMAAGIPCVATRIGSIPELIDSASGILVEQHNPAALTAALMRLARDPALRLSLGQKARARIFAEFDATVTTRALFDLICADGRRPPDGAIHFSLAGR